MILYSKQQLQRGFTLIELLLVAVILGILAAVVIPQFTNTSGSTRDQAVKANLAAVRNAIELYAAQHNGDYPGVKAAGGTFGAANSNTAFINQLTKYTDATGAVSESKTGSFTFGPYLKSIPVDPVTNSSAISFDTTGTLATIPTAAGNGWIFYSLVGKFMKNTNANDSSGVAYTTY